MSPTYSSINTLVILKYCLTVRCNKAVPITGQSDTSNFNNSFFEYELKNIFGPKIRSLVPLDEKNCSGTKFEIQMTDSRELQFTNSLRRRKMLSTKSSFRRNSALSNTITMHLSLKSSSIMV